MSQMTISSTATLSAWIDPRKHEDEALNGLSLMDRLWNQLDGMFIGLWSGKFPDERSMRNWRSVWGQAFVEEGITPAEIGRGLTAIRKHRYGVPQLPDFLAACRPTLTDEDAYHEAVQQMQIRRAPFKRDGVMVSDDRWSEPAVYWAAVSMESDLFNMPYERVKGRWSRALERARANKRGPVPVYRTALAAPDRCRIEPHEQKRVIGEIMSGLGKRAPEASTSGRKMSSLSDDNLAERKFAMQKALMELEAQKQLRDAAMA